MWHMDTPAGEVVLRALCVFSFIFVVFRMWGKKHFGQLTAFDFILLVIISETTQNALIGEDYSVLSCFTAISTLVLLNVLLDKLSQRSRFLEKLIDGNPEVIIKDGVVNWKILRREGITKSELEEAVREEGVLDVKDVKQATIETNGHISVIK